MRVFITGAANGIGQTTAEKLVENGHKVIAYDRDENGLEELPGEIQTYKGDVRDQERLEEVVRKEIFDSIVNCAGIQKQGAVEDMSVEDFQEQMEVNYIGTLNSVKTALPMVEERNGKIVNVSSIAGKVTTPFLAGYSASKHALEGFTDALRMELAKSNVDVILVEPGPVDTGFNKRGRENLRKYLPESGFSTRYREKLETDYEGEDPDKSAEKIRKALESRRTKARYVTPLKYYFLDKLRFFIPTRVKDYFFRSR